MKLLITGGAGFIGSNFVRYWLGRHTEDNIINYDKLTYAGHLSSIKDLYQYYNYRFIGGDILDRQQIDRFMENVDVVVHFAAESHVDRSIEDPSLFLKTNVLGTQVLLDSAVKNGVKRFHYISTDEIFGSLELNSNELFTEESKINPRSPYAASKASAELLVKAYAETYGLKYSITNCSNNFGPYQDTEKFIPRMITNLIDDQAIILYGDGLNVRDWLYVEDHCRAIEAVILQGRDNSTYLVGGNTEDINNLTVAKKLLEIFGKNEDFLEFITDRKGHDRRYSIDWGRINNDLGWQPENSFEAYLLKTVDWYKANESWWRPIKKESENFYQKIGQHG